MAAYAFRDTHGIRTLEEYPSFQHAQGAVMAAAAGRMGGAIIERCTADQARKWVKGGGQHETALFVDVAGKVRRADG